MCFHQWWTRACMPLVKICLPECGLYFTLLSPLLKRSTHHLTVLTSTVWSPSAFSKHQGMSVGAILLHIKEFSDTFLLHMHFHIKTILPDCPSVGHRNVMECQQEDSTSTAVLPVSSSDVMGQHNKIGSISFWAALIVYWSFPECFNAHLQMVPHSWTVLCAVASFISCFLS